MTQTAPADARHQQRIRHHRDEGHGEIACAAKRNLPGGRANGQLWRTANDPKWETVSEDLVLLRAKESEVIAAHNESPLRKGERCCKRGQSDYSLHSHRTVECLASAEEERNGCLAEAEAVALTCGTVRDRTLLAPLVRYQENFEKR